MQFETRIEDIERIQKEKKEGKLHYIPFDHHLPKFSKVFPGIVPKSNMIITSSTGSGKSKMWRFFGIKIPYDVCQLEKESGITFKFIGNCLEEPVEEILDHLIQQRIKEKYNILIDSYALSGFRKEPLPDEHLNLIKQELPYFSDLQKYIILHDIKSPFGFFKKVREYAFEHGTFYDDYGKPIDRDQKPNWSNIRWSTYVPDNPKEIVIVGVDHLTLFGSEQKMSEYETISKWSQDYMRSMINLKFGYATLTIQQQASGIEELSFDNKGNLLIQKLKPSISGLGKVKITSQEATEMIGIFSPDRFDVEEYKVGGVTYDIKNDFKSLFKDVYMIKGRRIMPFGSPMWLDPISETLHEINIKQYLKEKEPDYTGKYVYKELWKKYVNVF